MRPVCLGPGGGVIHIRRGLPPALDRQGKRRLRLAFAWSILIHVLVIGLGQPPRLPEVTRSLIVFIRPARLAGDGAAPMAKPSPRQERPPLLSMAQGESPTVPVPARAAPGGELPAPAGLVRAPTVGADSPESQVGELDAEGLRHYRVSLGGAMAGIKAYPALAQQRGWQGRVELLLRVVRGKPPQAVVDKSSGFPLLDAQARDMLQQAAIVTALPPSLGSRDFALPLTVVFDLEEQ